MPFILGTAGHIDHGKTTLVKALTGIDCDRLVEEKKRGITIELGFAHLDLPGGLRLGVVDVPGHEKFVKNMVAGASGIDFVLLVVAADEAVMPQTREHLEICELLGLKKGLVALTKADLVEPEWLDMVTEELRAFLEPTFLAHAPIIPVSAHTGLGLDQLRAALADMAATLAPRRAAGLPRLPVDRVFTMRGHGTVVTGTLAAGSIRVGDDLTVYPRGLATKARLIQSHGAQSEEAHAGQRTAVNLGGLEVADLERGDVVAPPGALFPSQIWDVRITALSSLPKPLKHRTTFHLHHGTRELLARLHLLDRDELAPGATATAQLHLPEPYVGVYGDHFVARSFSPLRTVAGGSLVNPMGRRVKRFSPEFEGLTRLAQADGAARLALAVELAGPSGLTLAQMQVATGETAKEAEKLLAQASGAGELLVYDRETKAACALRHLTAIETAILARTEDFHAKQPMREGISRAELASSLPGETPAKLLHLVLERMVRAGRLAAENDLVRKPAHKVSLASDTAKLKEALWKAFAGTGLTPPNLKDVLDPLAVSAKQAAPVFKLLETEGLLTRIKEDMYAETSALAGLVEQVTAFFTNHDDLSPNAFKELTGLSRKYAIPYLEYLDKSRVTIRVGDRRQLRPQAR